MCIWDFPGGPVVKNPPCNAWNMGSNPDGEAKIPYAAEQLSPSAATRVCAPQPRAHVLQLGPSVFE